MAHIQSIRRYTNLPYKGTWDADNPYVGPYINSHTNLTEIDQTMDVSTGLSRVETE